MEPRAVRKHADPVPQPPDTILLELSLEDAQALAAIWHGIGGPFKVQNGYSVPSTATTGQLSLNVYAHAWKGTPEQLRDRLRVIGDCVRAVLRERS